VGNTWDEDSWPRIFSLSLANNIMTFVGKLFELSRSSRRSFTHLEEESHF
jgi:hypothetical protein